MVFCGDAALAVNAVGAVRAVTGLVAVVVVVVVAVAGTGTRALTVTGAAGKAAGALTPKFSSDVFAACIIVLFDHGLFANEG